MEWVARDLQRLVDEDKVERAPTTEEWRAIVAAAKAWQEEYETAEGTEIDDFLYDHAPGLLLEWWRDVIRGNREGENEMWAEMNDERDKRSKMGKYSPKISITIELDARPDHVGDATEKQKAYLRQLGVREQEDVLRRLDKTDASKMIERVLAVRSQKGLPTEFQ